MLGNFSLKKILLGIFVIIQKKFNNVNCDDTTADQWAPLNEKCEPVPMSNYTPLYNHLNEIVFDDQKFKEALNYHPQLADAICKLYDEQFGNLAELKCSKTNASSLSNSEPITFKQNGLRYEVTQTEGMANTIKAYNGRKLVYQYKYNDSGEIIEGAFNTKANSTDYLSGMGMGESTQPDRVYLYKEGEPLIDSTESWGVLSQGQFLNRSLSQALHLCLSGQVNTETPANTRQVSPVNTAQ